MMMIVVPTLSQGQQRQPKIVAAVVARLIAARSKDVTEADNGASHGVSTPVVSRWFFCSFVFLKKQLPFGTCLLIFRFVDFDVVR